MTETTAEDPCPSCGRSEIVDELRADGIYMHPADARQNLCGFRQKWPRWLRLALSGLLVLVLLSIVLTLYAWRDVTRTRADVRSLIQFVVMDSNSAKLAQETGDGAPGGMRGESGD